MTDTTTTTRAASEAVPCTRRPGYLWTACRCPVCAPRDARVKKAHKAGLLTVPPNDRAWDRVEQWAARGWTAEAVSSATGMSVEAAGRALLRARTGAPRYVLMHGTAARILTAGPPTAGSVGPVGASRRLRALARIGWPTDVLLTETGISVSYFHYIRRAEGAYVAARMHNAITDVYARLALTPGPDPGTAARAARAHWPGPLSWDDATIDDPDARPLGVLGGATERVTRESVIEAVETCIAGGYASLAEVADRAGLPSVTALEKRLERAGRRDLWAALGGSQERKRRQGGATDVARSADAATA